MAWDNARPPQKPVPGDAAGPHHRHHAHVYGVLMPSVGWTWVGIVRAYPLVWMFPLDAVKVGCTDSCATSPSSRGLRTSAV